MIQSHRSGLEWFPRPRTRVARRPRTNPQTLLDRQRCSDRKPVEGQGAEDQIVCINTLMYLSPSRGANGARRCSADNLLLTGCWKLETVICSSVSDGWRASINGAATSKRLTKGAKIRLMVGASRLQDRRQYLEPLSFRVLQQLARFPGPRSIEPVCPQSGRTILARRFVQREISERLLEASCPLGRPTTQTTLGISPDPRTSRDRKSPEDRAAADKLAP